MKTFLIAIILAIVVTVGMTIMTFLTLQDNMNKQNQEEKIQARIHVYTENATGYINGTKFVKMSDLAPNSSVRFSYPYSGNSTLDISAWKAWQLLRLPDDLGGNKDDISSFRAYSMVDIAVGCLVQYKTQSEKLVDSCHDDTFEPVNGIAISGNAIYSKYSALPNLDLGVDDQGYIYARQPVFEFDKNGVIGAGRNVFHCTDPQQTDLQYDVKRLTTRHQVESIVLANSTIQKIINGNSCEFMAEGTLYTENGTYQTININLNNTKDLAASVSLQNNSVVSYQLGNMARTYSVK